MSINTPEMLIVKLAVRVKWRLFRAHVLIEPLQCSQSNINPIGFFKEAVSLIGIDHELRGCTQLF